MEAKRAVGLVASFIPFGYMTIDTVGDLFTGRKNVLQAAGEIIVGLGATALCIGETLNLTDPDSWRLSPVSGVTDFDYTKISWEDVCRQVELDDK